MNQQRQFLKSETQYKQLINIAKNQLGLDEEQYRNLLFDVCKKRSLTKMSRLELDSVLHNLKKMGFKVKQTAKSKKSPASNNQQIDKMRAIWIEMGNVGMISDNSEQALNAWVKRQSSQLNGGIGVDSLEWLQRDRKLTNAVLESLKQWQKRLIRQWQSVDMNTISTAQKIWDVEQRVVIETLLHHRCIMHWEVLNDIGITDRIDYLKHRGEINLENLASLEVIDNANNK